MNPVMRDRTSWVPAVQTEHYQPGQSSIRGTYGAHHDRIGQATYPRMLQFIEHQTVKMLKKRVEVRASTGKGRTPASSTLPARSARCRRVVSVPSLVLGLDVT